MEYGEAKKNLRDDEQKRLVFFFSVIIIMFVVLALRLGQNPDY